MVDTPSTGVAFHPGPVALVIEGIDGSVRRTTVPEIRYSLPYAQLPSTPAQFPPLWQPSSARSRTACAPFTGRVYVALPSVEPPAPIALAIVRVVPSSSSA